MGGSVKPCIHKQLAENVCILRGGGRKIQGEREEGRRAFPLLPERAPWEGPRSTGAVGNSNGTLPEMGNNERALKDHLLIVLVRCAQLKDNRPFPGMGWKSNRPGK